MNFADGIGWQACDVALGIDAVVRCVDDEVIQIEQQAAIGATDELSQKFRLGKAGFFEGDVTREMLEQDRSAQLLLYALNARRYMCKRGLCERERQQIVVVDAIGSTPAQMFRHDSRLITILKSCELPQV